MQREEEVGANWEMGRAIIFKGEGLRESPLGRNLHFSDITCTVRGLKNGNNTPATGESSKQRILFFEHLLLHHFLLLLPTPVLKSDWGEGPFCLSMMSYLVRVVAICQHTNTDSHNTCAHTATACSTSVLQSSTLCRGLFPLTGNRFTHDLKPISSFHAGQHLSVLFQNNC